MKAATMPNKAASVMLALWPLIAFGQKPVISTGGVVNAASYSMSTNPTGIPYLEGGSIVSIFGKNLSASTETAQVVPLPTSLGGTSVTVEGVAAPLFYVSPNQINFQMPQWWFFPWGFMAGAGIVVTTAAGSSDPYPLGSSNSPLGIFALDSSGCGRGAIFNVRADGSVSLNSPANSVSPGEFLTIYGTGVGFVYNSPQDGAPAPVNPLASAEFRPVGVYDFVEDTGFTMSQLLLQWAGRAPGWVGVDQFNVRVPQTVREGCAVPVEVQGGNFISQPVTVAIRNGGGACVDPPEAGYGEVLWQKTVGTSAAGTATASEQVTVSLQESPGKQAPPVPVYTEGPFPSYQIYYGSSCPIPGYQSLGAGTATAQGPGFGPSAVPVAPLQQGQVGGLTVYQASLPAGTIGPGTFTIAASGGTDVGAFQSSVQIGSGIQITSPLAGVHLCGKPITINWKGGDSSSWVTITVIGHGLGSDGVSSISRLHASAGTFTITYPPTITSSCTGGTPAELRIDVEPDPSQRPGFSAPGLTLGGRQSWKYTYSFAVLVG